MEAKYPCEETLLHQQQLQQQQFATRILEHLAFNSDILERWHQIGTSQGFSTDLEVATFLIQHYENTWDRAQPTEFCVTCHSPLTPTCIKCFPLANSHAPTPTPPSHHDPLSPLFPAPDISAPYNSAGSKGKKRGKSARVGSGDTDEDLLGLYIQFSQPPCPSPPQPSMAPALPRKVPGKVSGKKKRREDAAARSKPVDESGGRLKGFVCVHCGKTIFKRSDYLKHVRIHTREKPYKCTLCHAAFSDSSSAARHRRVHTGEKPFQCPQCPSAFAQSSDLTKHSRVHTLERPWTCQLCQQTFSDSSRFARHRRQHERQARSLKAGKGHNQGSDLVVS